MARGDHRFFDSGRRAYAHRLAKLIDEEGCSDDVMFRIGKYSDVVMIDEVQDFAAHDFNFLSTIARADTDTIFVGDFFQHTFDTSRDGRVRENLHRDFDEYVNEFRTMGIEPDSETLSHSYRCSPTVCEYVSTNLGIDIKSHRSDETRMIFLNSEDDIRRIYNDNNVVKLFYQRSSSYACYSNNWGASKGEDYHMDVCVVLYRESYEKFQSEKLMELKPSPKNKLYVAITRARGDLYFVEEQQLKNVMD